MDIERSPSSRFVCSATITLGGVEDTDGVRGLIASGHAVASKSIRDLLTATDWRKTGMKVSHGSRGYREEPARFLGTVFKMPQLLTDKNGKIWHPADAAFIAYPKDPTTNTYREPLAPLKIRGEGDTVYTVIGSRESIEGESVWISGSRTGYPVKHTALKTILAGDGTSDRPYIYHTLNKGPEGEKTRSGDSGAPVYTEPDASGNTYILGIHTGSVHSGPGVTDGSDNYSAYSPWKSVENTFDLKPIGE